MENTKKMDENWGTPNFRKPPNQQLWIYTQEKEGFTFTYQKYSHASPGQYGCTTDKHSYIIIIFIGLI